MQLQGVKGLVAKPAVPASGYGYLRFMLQQPHLAVQATGIASQTAVGADDAMTGHHNSNWVTAIGSADGAHGFRVLQMVGDCSVTAAVGKGDGTECLPYLLLKARP